MAIKYQKISREQLDRTLAGFKPLKELPPPSKGWIRAIRNALGMSGRQLGKRMRVSKMRVTDIERAEVTGAATLKTLRRAAEALDCTLIYALVPNTSLEDTLKKQALKKARRDMVRASHTMALEDQALPPAETKAAEETAAESLIIKLPRNLWD